jgi:hypothetical protein
VKEVLIRSLKVNRFNYVTVIALLFVSLFILFNKLNYLHTGVLFFLFLVLVKRLFLEYVPFDEVKLYPSFIAIVKRNKVIKKIEFSDISNVEFSYLLAPVFTFEWFNEVVKIPVTVERSEYIVESIRKFNPKSLSHIDLLKYKSKILRTVFFKENYKRSFLFTSIFVVISVGFFLFLSHRQMDSVGQAFELQYNTSLSVLQLKTFINTSLGFGSIFLYVLTSYCLLVLFLFWGRQIVTADVLRSRLRVFKRMNWGLSCALLAVVVYSASFSAPGLKETHLTMQTLKIKKQALIVDYRYNCINCVNKLQLEDEVVFRKNYRQKEVGTILAMGGADELSRSIASEAISNNAKVYKLSKDEYLVHAQLTNKYTTIKHNTLLKNLQFITKFKHGNKVWFAPGSVEAKKFPGHFDIIGLPNQRYVSVLGKHQLVNELDQSLITNQQIHQVDGQEILSFSYNLKSMKLKGSLLVKSSNNNFELIRIKDVYGIKPRLN